MLKEIDNKIELIKKTELYLILDLEKFDFNIEKTEQIYKILNDNIEKLIENEDEPLLTTDLLKSNYYKLGFVFVNDTMLILNNLEKTNNINTKLNLNDIKKIRNNNRYFCIENKENEAMIGFELPSINIILKKNNHFYNHEKIKIFNIISLIINKNMIKNLNKKNITY